MLCNIVLFNNRYKKNSDKFKSGLDTDGEMQESGLEPISNYVIFQTATGKVNIDVYFYDETLWLTQKKMAELFEKGRSTITEHLKKIFEDGELDEKVVCREFRHTTQHGAIEGKNHDIR